MGTVFIERNGVQTLRLVRAYTHGVCTVHVDYCAFLSVACLHDPVTFYTEQLRAVLTAESADASLLPRIIVTRCEVSRDCMC